MGIVFHKVKNEMDTSSFLNHLQVYVKKPSLIVLLFVLLQKEKTIAKLEDSIFTGITRCRWENITLLESFYLFVYHPCLLQFHILHCCVFIG